MLAAASPVKAWYVTFYDNTQSCKVGDETEYQILEGDQFDCNTFGASMDGVDCVHFVEETSVSIRILDSVDLQEGQNPEYIRSFRCQNSEHVVRLEN
ncbi:hypothetical protein FPCIR_1452 [Fusarium pseudocircinatum]|uniref:Uncharacterized protein n=1 Tax=Fusarium pseudocircinatum TaxID=56676 RepID=A0A8H5UXU9_9HYPO|nr:hypothetical protein FPCIR_1452 [Fusarium pseudocircinatum]